jgi:cell division protein FtsA
VLQPLASSYAVLTEDEKDLGVCLVDIGGGTTDIACSPQGAIRHTAVIPIAGDQITNDIAMACARRPGGRRHQVRYGCALSQLADPTRASRCPASATAAAQAVAPGAGRGDRAARRGALFELVQASCAAPASRRCCPPASC